MSGGEERVIFSPRGLGPARLEGKIRRAPTSLFLEATQLKTVRTVAAVLRIEPAVAEAQVVGIGTRNRRRPAVPVAADAIQRTGAGVATARGGGGARGPLGRSCSTCDSTPEPGPKNVFAPTVSDRAPGDSFYFAKSEIVESLLRRGARVPLGTRTGLCLP